MRGELMHNVGLTGHRLPEHTLAESQGFQLVSYVKMVAAVVGKQARDPRLFARRESRRGGKVPQKGYNLARKK